MSDQKVWLVPAPAAAWGSTSPRPPWPPATPWSQPAATQSKVRAVVGAA